VSKSYTYIPQSFVEEYVKACRICACHKSFPAQTAARPIESRGFLDRLQVDLICMSHIPDGDFKYICHVHDHFSRFSWARAMTTKQAKEVALFLFEIFTTFGAPLILHSDNGKEFVANIIHELLKLWTGINVVNGRPRHPQSQGCVERGNKILQERLSKWMASSESVNWSIGLPLVICK
jgi:transposase InsO family protein